MLQHPVRVFYQLIRSGFFLVLTGTVYAAYRTAVCLREPTLRAMAELGGMPYLLETLAAAALVMAAGGAIGTYLLRHYGSA